MKSMLLRTRNESWCYYWHFDCQRCQRCQPQSWHFSVVKELVHKKLKQPILTFSKGIEWLSTHPWAICSGTHNDNDNGTSTVQTFHHYHLTPEVLSIAPSILEIKWFLSLSRSNTSFTLPCLRTWQRGLCHPAHGMIPCLCRGRDASPRHIPGVLLDREVDPLWAGCAGQHCVWEGSWPSQGGQTDDLGWAARMLLGEQAWQLWQQGRGRQHLWGGPQWQAIANAWSSHYGDAVATVQEWQAVCVSSWFHVSAKLTINNQPFYQRGASKWRINLQLFHSNLKD